MRITLITPTADQPIGIRLLEKYVQRQTVKYDQWIIADDGVESATLTMGQTHLIRKRRHEGGASLVANVLAMIPEIKGDIIIILEHDDYYSADHIAVCIEQLRRKNIMAVGSQWQRYYNLQVRKWIQLRNIGSALCNTAFKKDVLLNLQRAAESAFRKKSYGVDRFFWESIPQSQWGVHQINTVVGMKGLPGRKGLGVGHRPDKRRHWRHDPNGEQLKRWVGSDAAEYLAIKYA